MEKNISKINSTVNEYFNRYSSIDKIAAKDLMNDFIKAGIYKKDDKKGLPIRNDLRDLDKARKLHLIPSAVAERKTQNTNWFFRRTVNFKGEIYTDTSSNLFKKLNSISSGLEMQLIDKTKCKKVGEVIRLIKQGKSFKEIWGVEANVQDKGEYKGLYLFAEKLPNRFNPVYVGISQRIGKRFDQHTLKGSKQHASWAYMMAKYEFTMREFGYYKKMFSPDIETEKKWIKEKQDWISKLYFTFLLEEDNYLLHMAEIFSAAKFNCKWNSFETH